MERHVSYGYRVFVFTAEKVTHLSRKTFDKFYLRNEPALKAYADQTINLAMVTYTLKNRKPAQIVTIDTLRIAVDENGMMNAEFADRYNRLIVHRLNSYHQPSLAGDQGRTTPQNVVNAAIRFDKRGWDTFNPKLPGPIHKQILDSLFP